MISNSIFNLFIRFFLLPDKNSASLSATIGTQLSVQNITCVVFDPIKLVLIMITWLEWRVHHSSLVYVWICCVDVWRRRKVLQSVIFLLLLPVSECVLGIYTLHFHSGSYFQRPTFCHQLSWSPNFSSLGEDFSEEDVILCCVDSFDSQSCSSNFTGRGSWMWKVLCT